MGSALYIEALIDRFIAEKATLTAPPALSTLTLQDMLADPVLKTIIDKSFATVNENATLADAKAAVDTFSMCQDILIIKAGTRNEPVIGRITNSIIENNARV